MILVSIFEKLAPIVFFLALGVLFRTKRFLSAQTIDEIKQLLVRVTLPALLFLTFLELDFHREYVFVIILMFVINLVMLGAGHLAGKIIAPGNRYAPLMFTGFEMGMLGFSLFGISFGQAGLQAIGILDLGQELYVWFILTTLLTFMTRGKPRLGTVVSSFFTSPVILAILIGMALNAFLPEGLLETLPGYTGIDTALSMLAGLTIPLILVIIGYQLRFRLSGFASPLALLASRTILLLGFAVLMDRLVFPRLADVPELLAPAMYTLAILPPPFIMPLFMDGASEKEAESVGTTLSLGTLVTLALFFVLLVVYGV